ncbi:hypothetical protein GQ53DRAFT_753233 [Thozetella sp. PMI_491]|nr:hypothetical protein GQ53DRAFT_753233 [Thozetella sp. PMI_491]
MASNDDAQEQLLASIAGLFDNPKYADLLIITARKTFHAHRAILYPRSAYFAKGHEVPSPEGPARLNLDGDDPEAVGRLLEFVYKLDYNVNHVSASETNGAEAPAEPVNGNGIHTAHEVDKPAEDPEPEPETPKAEEIVDTIDDFIPRQSPKKGKKKKRAKSVAPLPEAGVLDPHPGEESPTTVNGGAQESAPDSKTNGGQVAEAPSAPYIPGNQITAHSRVYTLSKKYDITSLKPFALGRFENRAAALWNTDDFVQAAKEVYTASSAGQDRETKDVILRVISQNPSVLDKEELKEVIRRGDLGLDLVLHLKTQGGFRSDSEDPWGY